MSKLTYTKTLDSNVKDVLSVAKDVLYIPSLGNRYAEDLSVLSPVLSPNNASTPLGIEEVSNLTSLDFPEPKDVTAAAEVETNIVTAIMKKAKKKGKTMVESNVAIEDELLFIEGDGTPQKKSKRNKKKKGKATAVVQKQVESKLETQACEAAADKSECSAIKPECLAEKPEFDKQASKDTDTTPLIQIDEPSTLTYFDKLNSTIVSCSPLEPTEPFKAFEEIVSDIIQTSESACDISDVITGTADDEDADPTIVVDKDVVNVVDEKIDVATAIGKDLAMLNCLVHPSVDTLVETETKNLHPVPSFISIEAASSPASSETSSRLPCLRTLLPTSISTPTTIAESAAHSMSTPLTAIPDSFSTALLVPDSMSTPDVVSEFRPPRAKEEDVFVHMDIKVNGVKHEPPMAQYIEEAKDCHHHYFEEPFHEQISKKGGNKLAIMTTKVPIIVAEAFTNDVGSHEMKFACYIMYKEKAADKCLSVSHIATPKHMLRRGYGKLLMNHMMTYAKKTKKFRMVALSSMPTSIKFYQALKFKGSKPSKKEQDDIAPGQIFMTKKL